MQYIKQLSEVINDISCMSIGPNIDFGFSEHKSSFKNDEVEIMAHRFDRNQKILYKVRRSNNKITYEPESRFSNCSECILNYWNSTSGEEPNKIFIYCRISTISQNNIQNGHASFITQETNCRNCAYKANAPICGVIREIHSARNIYHQPLLMKLINCLDKNNLLLIWNVSRFSRDTVGGQSMIEKIHNKGASVCFIDDDIIISPNCKPIIMHKFRELLSHSKLESDIISWRVKGQKNLQAAKGSYMGGQAPYGYKINMENKIRKFTEVKKEQKIIKKIKCDVRNKKRKYSEIAEQFNSMSFTKRGKKWTSSSVKYIYFKNYQNQYQKFTKSTR